MEVSVFIIPARFAPRKETSHTLNRRLGRPQSLSARFEYEGGEKNPALYVVTVRKPYQRWPICRRLNPEKIILKKFNSN